MKTPYNEIVNIASIGSQTNPISLNEILRWSTRSSRSTRRCGENDTVYL